MGRDGAPHLLGFVPGAGQHWLALNDQLLALAALGVTAALCLH